VEAKYNAEIMAMEVMPDHAHLLCQVDPQFEIYPLVKNIQRVRSPTLRKEFLMLRSRIPTVWTNRYSVSAVEMAPPPVIKPYVENRENGYTLRCHKVCRFRLEPRGSQGLELERTASVSRFIYSWGPDRCQTYYKANGKSLPGSQLSRELAELKHTAPWLYDFDSPMQQQALANLKRAYVNFFAGRAKFPKFKNKKSAQQSFRIPQIEVWDGDLYIPTIGKVAPRPSEVIDLPTESATFKRTAVGHWFVTLVAEFEMPAAKVPNGEEKVAGLDAVLQPPDYLVGSDGSAVPGRRYYRKMERKLGRAHRHLSRCQRRSHNRSQAKLRAARMHERVANLRKEFVHQLSHKLVQRWDVLCVEDLNLKSLAKSKQTKSWFDASFGELFRQIEYKCLWESKHFVQVDRIFASSKPCSACGFQNDDLHLSDRQWKCPSCSTEHGRDINAAINIKPEGLPILAAECAESRNAHGPRMRLAEASSVGGSGHGRKRKAARPPRIPCFRHGESSILVAFFSREAP
jgi:putative transposase